MSRWRCEECIVVDCEGCVTVCELETNNEDFNTPETCPFGRDEEVDWKKIV